GHQRQRAIGAKSGIVHQAVNWPETLAQSGDEALHLADVGEIERKEADRILALLRGLGHRCGELIACPAGDNDNAISRGCEFLCNCETETAAAARDDHIPHHEPPLRKSLPVSDTVRLGTKRIIAGTLCGATFFRHRAIISRSVCAVVPLS